MGLLKEFMCRKMLKIKSKFSELSFMIHDQSRRADRCVYNIQQVTKECKFVQAQLELQWLPALELY